LRILPLYSPKSVCYISLLVGMEVAAYLSDKAKSVTCVDVCDIPFARILGNRVGLFIQKVRECIREVDPYKGCVTHI